MLKSILAFIGFPYMVAFYAFVGLFDSYKPAKGAAKLGDVVMTALAVFSAAIQFGIIGVGFGLYKLIF